MAKTRAQKEELIKAGEKEFKDSKFLIFTDFSETPDSSIKVLRNSVRDKDSKFKVINKRLLRVMLNKAGIEFDPVKYEKHVGTIFAKSDISEIAPAVYKFSKANPTLNLLGGFDVINKEEITLDQLIEIGKLPSREVLLAQLMGGLTGPLRKLMYVLTELANKGEEEKAEEQKEEVVEEEQKEKAEESAKEEKQEDEASAEEKKEEDKKEEDKQEETKE